MDMSKIWAYQQADLEVDRYEQQLKGSSNRTRMLKLRSSVKDLQNGMQKIETDIQRFHLALGALRKERDVLEAAIDDGLALVDEKKVADLDRIRAMQADASSIISQLGGLQQDVERVQQEIALYEKNYRDTLMRAVTAKKEFDTLKVAYDAEIAGAKDELADLQRKRDVMEQELDSAFLQRYKVVKSHITPPLVVLNGDRCGGCNMSLPSVVIKDVKDAKRIVECDNCSRILFAAP